jgi:hypothetical protein
MVLTGLRGMWRQKQLLLAPHAAGLIAYAWRRGMVAMIKRKAGIETTKGELRRA